MQERIWFMYECDDDDGVKRATGGAKPKSNIRIFAWSYIRASCISESNDWILEFYV